jgi:hypothetical protein
VAQIFHRSFNTISKASLLALLVVAMSAAWVWGKIQRSPWVTEAGVARDQPIPFSHKHHVSDCGIDCRYCHSSVDDSPFAGMPSTRTCMTCHSQLFSTSPLLEPVRASWRDDRSIEWTRVHDLPDFVYFDHSVHVRGGVACERCHGDVGQMPLLWRENSLLMTWCLDCHRHPDRLGSARDPKALLECYACHR